MPNHERNMIMEGLHPPWCTRKGEELFRETDPGTPFAGWDKIQTVYHPPAWSLQVDSWQNKMLLRAKDGLKTATWNELHDEHGFHKNVHRLLCVNKEEWEIAISRRREKGNVSHALKDMLRWDTRGHGVQMCKGGWVPVSQLLKSEKMMRMKATKADIYGCIAWNKKPRFQLSQKLNFVRVMTGHMFSGLEEGEIFELAMTTQNSSEFMVHATYTKHISNIMRYGLNKGKRSHIHIAHSEDDVNRK
jgi:RNA:NAD 2'-phosphotransferase (TPT1/KptA family)